jgi:hypothetical protein
MDHHGKGRVVAQVLQVVIIMMLLMLLIQAKGVQIAMWRALACWVRCMDCHGQGRVFVTQVRRWWVM